MYLDIKNSIKLTECNRHCSCSMQGGIRKNFFEEKNESCGKRFNKGPFESLHYLDRQSIKDSSRQSIHSECKP